MDFSPILTSDVCAKCKNCCIFKKESLIYVPEGIEVREQNDGMFVCAHRNENFGCSLGKNKPVECAAWPFSIAKLGNELFLVLERSCRELEGTETIKKFAMEIVASVLLTYYRRNLAKIRDYNKLSQVKLFQVRIV